MGKTLDLLRQKYPDRVALTVTEAAKVLGVNNDALRRLAVAGNLPARFAGQRKLLIPVVALAGWVDGQEFREKIQKVNHANPAT